jgi:hypothetical protein
MGRTSQEVGVMPKEIISGRYFGTSETPEAHAVVGWTRDIGHVELAVAQPYDRQPNIRTIPDVLRDELTDPKWTGDSNYAATLEQMIQVYERGWYMQLDRDGINRLIRSLRRARDAAFGKDA